METVITGVSDIPPSLPGPSEPAQEPPKAPELSSPPLPSDSGVHIDLLA